METQIIQIELSSEQIEALWCEAQRREVSFDVLISEVIARFLREERGE
jgi:hypothetical protein